MKKKILISISSQFGYHTDSYMYCKYLDKQKYEVHYVCFDFGYEHKFVEDVTIHYIPIHKNKVLRYLNYVWTIKLIVKRNNFDLLFIINTQASYLIRISNLFKKSIFDIRTGDIWMSKKNFSVFDWRVRFTTYFFKHVSIISMNLANKMHLNAQKCHYLPLGGEIRSCKKKSFDALKLLYVGVLSGRNIYQTVQGISIFIQNHPNVSIQYDIVGYGNSKEENFLIETIQQQQLNHFVTFHGRKTHDEIQHLFDDCNVGVVYVPLTYGYNCQPSTKLFESYLAGMPVIASNTLENSFFVDDLSGVLVEDSATSFYFGLKQLWNNRHQYDSEIIIEKHKQFSWEFIVKNNLEHYIDNIINE